MSITRDVNPLNVADNRFLTFTPPHFTTFYYKRVATERIVKNWVYENLHGRFSMGASSTDAASSFVAFEDQTEITLFALSLNTFNNSILW